MAGHAEDRTAEGIRCYLGVDELGRDRGYEYDQAAMGEHSGLVGHFEKPTVSPGSGLVTAHADCDPDTTATVLAVFASQPVVYRLTGDGPAYAGLKVLRAGDVVRVTSVGNAGRQPTGGVL